MALVEKGLRMTYSNGKNLLFILSKYGFRAVCFLILLSQGPASAEDPSLIKDSAILDKCNKPAPPQWSFKAGQSYFGRNKYIEYIPGTLPIIIIAPHGGYLTPSSIPPMANTLERDGGSQEYTHLVAHNLFKLTGHYPHRIINHLTRDRLQANSDKVEATNRNPEAAQAFDEFHNYIEQAKTFVKATCSRGLLLDLHTNGHDEGWVELGFGLTGSDLNLNSDQLNQTQYFGKTTLHGLILNSKHSFIEIIRGPSSLGGFLNSAGIKVVPSPQFPGPKSGGYFDGGYNVRKHGSQYGGGIDAIQIESHFNYVNSGKENREAYSKKLSEAILNFFKSHY